MSDSPRRLRQDLAEARKTIERLSKYETWVPPGHFYSPIPDLDEIRAREADVFMPEREIPGLELNEDKQLKLLESFVELYDSIPFGAKKSRKHRYYYENPAYAYNDGIILHCMLRTLKPKRVIEVGSGFSSAVTLDTNDLFFDGSIELTFIEPFPRVLREVVGSKELATINLIERPLQDVDLSVFESLEANDILFIDSTHVSKIGSDVNYIFFEILPRLKKGVHIHFHDIFYPFEYPQQWVYEGRCWTEIYVLRAFLQYNNEFQITYFQNMMTRRHRAFFEEKLPLCMKLPGGNIWLKRVSA